MKFVNDPTVPTAIAAAGPPGMATNPTSVRCP